MRILEFVDNSVLMNASFSAENYNSTGFTDRFIAIEYCLGVLPEWLSCVFLSSHPSRLLMKLRSAALLLCTYGTSRRDPTSAKEDLSAQKNKEVDNSNSA